MEALSTTIEWIFSKLLRHPRVMRKLQEELENVVGMDRKIEETDLGNLIYFDMIIKEDLRLHPATPLMLPHESMKDTMINSYYIAKNFRIIINSWSIVRDRNAWSNNAEEFFPERFMENDIDLKGHHFQLLPFRSGRRGCPGMHLAVTTDKLVVAQLVHCFSWELPDGMPLEDLDGGGVWSNIVQSQSFALKVDLSLTCEILVRHILIIRCLMLPRTGKI